MSRTHTLSEIIARLILCVYLSGTFSACHFTHYGRTRGRNIGQIFVEIRQADNKNNDQNNKLNRRCQAGKYCSDSPCNEPNCSHSCKTDASCPSYPQAICVNTECVELGQRCRTGSDCPLFPTTLCVDSRCMKLGQSCTVDEDCPKSPKIYCVYNRCSILGQECTVDEHCPFYPLTSCVSARCTKLGQSCRVDADCPLLPHTMCLNQKCSKISRECASNNDCPKLPDMFCVERRCVKLGQACRTDSQCPHAPITTCISFRCTILDEQCVHDADCPLYPEVLCINFKCVRVGQYCRADKDCPKSASIICMNSKCVRFRQTCQLDTDCDYYPQTVCVNKQCMHVGRNCSSDDDCPHNPATQCISNRCIKLNQLCTSNADCPSLRGMVCSSGKCAYFGKTCTDDDECSNQMKCVINQCVRLGQPCSSDDDCPIPMTICTSSRCDKLTERTSAPYRAQTGVSTPLTATTFATTTEVPSVCRTTVEERNNILELHNTRRAMIAQGKMKKANGDGSYLPRASWMYMLKWDCRLENMAYEHATACSLKHSDPDTRVGIGENIFVTPHRHTNGSDLARLAMEDWWTATKYYDVSNLRYDDVFATSELYSAWSQTAWGLTSKIGCYSYLCSEHRFLVCLYEEGGNKVGKYIYGPGVTCTACPYGCVTDKASQYYGLCNSPP